MYHAAVRQGEFDATEDLHCTILAIFDTLLLNYKNE